MDDIETIIEDFLWNLFYEKNYKNENYDTLLHIFLTQEKNFMEYVNSYGINNPYSLTEKERDILLNKLLINHNVRMLYGKYNLLGYYYKKYINSNFYELYKQFNETPKSNNVSLK